MDRAPDVSKHMTGKRKPADEGQSDRPWKAGGAKGADGDKGENGRKAASSMEEQLKWVMALCEQLEARVRELEQAIIKTVITLSTHAAVEAAGFKSLSYFDVGNFGTRVVLPPASAAGDSACGVRPDGGPAPCWSPAETASSAFLWDHLSSGLLERGWSEGGGFFQTYLKDWVGTVVMDPGDAAFQDLIVDQAKRHLLLKTFRGLAVDRLDYTTNYNLDGDDGVSWVPRPNSSTGGPARSLRRSHTEIFERISKEALQDSDKVFFMNCNTLCRVDLLSAFDGTFSEGAALNAVAWAGPRVGYQGASLSLQRVSL